MQLLFIINMKDTIKYSIFITMYKIVLITNLIYIFLHRMLPSNTSNKRNTFGPGSKTKRFKPQLDRDPSKMIKLGLDSEKNYQTYAKFIQELHTNLAPTYPKTACLIIGWTIIYPPLPVIPIAPAPMTSTQRHFWEINVLKEYTDDLGRTKKLRDDINLEQVKCCGEIKKICYSIARKQIKYNL